MENILNVVGGINPLIATAANEVVTKDEFGATPPSSNEFSVSRIIGILMTLVAFYLLSKCRNTPGFNMILNIIAAFCCAPFYIIYRLFIAPC
jgi:hypothetical protein